LERLCPRNSTQTSCGHLFSLKFYTVLREIKPLLNHNGQFPDLLALLTKNILCSGGQDNDFCPGWCNSDINPRVAIFSQLLSEKLVQFSFKDAIGNKLPLLGNLHHRLAAMGH